MRTDSFHTACGVPVTALTADGMRAVDRVATEDVGLGLLQMMENAGRTLAGRVLTAGNGPMRIVAGNGGNVVADWRVLGISQITDGQFRSCWIGLRRS